MLEAILKSEGEIDDMPDRIDVPGRKTHVRPFLDVYGMRTTRGGKVWLRVQDPSGAYWSDPAPGCRAGLRFVSRLLGVYPPDAPAELMQIVLKRPAANRRKIRFVQRTSVFNLPPGTGVVLLPLCYLGEVWRSKVGWMATAISIKETSSKCR